MTNTFTDLISGSTGISNSQINSVLSLLSEGATIPFISRYRKEATSNLDELQIGLIQSEYERYEKIDARKHTILSAIREQGKLTNELEVAILNTYDTVELEDIYLPFRQKRKTRAETARKNGLEPLAKLIMAQREQNVSLQAERFLNPNVVSAEMALQGARDIVAEWVNENKQARQTIRSLFEKQANISSSVVKTKIDDAQKYSDYFNYEERLNRCKSHRLLALRRGEEEGFLRVSIRPPEETAIERLNRQFLRNDPENQVEMAIKDAYKRLLAPSIETEFAAQSKEKADLEAIQVFAENLRQLLLTAPLGEKRILAVDPGFRSGCKLVCLDQNGKLLYNDTIYPHPPQLQTKQAMGKINTLVQQYKIEAIAIGNGTAGRETENLIRRIHFKEDVQVFVVNEAGASIYSASPEAREEFPDYDVTVRGAVSIGRRLMDPLAELVKIDPKSIGVGQYQHDVDQKLLKEALETVVISCVNQVGVDVNTASRHLLQYVSGLGPQLAQNIIEFRNENGAYKSREDLKKVPRLGNKAFEQCAGFLRIKNGDNPLDNSAVHPESYYVVYQIAAKTGIPVEKLIGNKAEIEKINFEDFLTNETGMATLTDIKKELLKPGLDPRKMAEVFEFAAGVRKISDLTEGMILPGIVTNITNFGAFVDVGVKQDGLVHISHLADEFISNPTDVVSLNQKVMVKVLSVDEPRKRIGLSIKDAK